MKDTGAESGELCGFCKTAMNTGAVVYTGCGATRQIRPTGLFSALCSLVFFLAICALFVAVPWIFMQPTSLYAWLVLVLPWVVGFALGSLAPTRIQYLRKEVA